MKYMGIAIAFSWQELRKTDRDCQNQITQSRPGSMESPLLRRALPLPPHNSLANPFFPPFCTPFKKSQQSLAEKHHTRGRTCDYRSPADSDGPTIVSFTRDRIDPGGQAVTIKASLTYSGIIWIGIPKSRCTPSVLPSSVSCSGGPG